MSKIATVSALTLAATLAAAAPALAGPTCTDAPRDQWMAEAAMRAKATETRFKEIRIFKVTKGNCYEIYGLDKDGNRSEVYFNPVTGDAVESK